MSLGYVLVGVIPGAIDIEIALQCSYRIAGVVAYELSSVE
jgi:hypothetical protein